MFDFNKCEICTEKRCELAFLQITPKQKESNLLLKKLKEIRKKKITDYWIKEKKFYTKMKDSELALINYNRKPYMNESDWIHDNIWFICIQKLMELDDLYYKGLNQIRNAEIQDLI